MSNKISNSISQFAPEEIAAGQIHHHMVLGPGEALSSEWQKAGLELPDLDTMRQYRLDRIRAMLKRFNYDGIILMDPMNIRYATDATNMQIWVMHNNSRYAWVGADGSVVLWDYVECEFLSGHNPRVDEVRPAISAIFFLVGSRYAEKANLWADEMLDVIAEHCGKKPRIAIDQCHQIGYERLAEAGVSVGNGQEVMEHARLIKCADEIKAMRCAMHACEATMEEMWQQFKPGMTERELWALLHAGNIRRAGEWIETQLLSSGPRTNPWMQEASSRMIEAGDIVAYDTDLVGSYGMMVDISRTWIAGNVKAKPPQQVVYDLALHQIQHNIELLTPGRSFYDVSHQSWHPPVDQYRHYGMLFHGVGQCDEYPEIPFAHHWGKIGDDGILQPGMVMTVEAFVGSRDGGEGVKLEEQVLITETGYEQLSTYPIDLVR